MRLLHVIPTLVGGGAERQLALLANALAERGHEIHVGFVHSGPNEAQLRGGRVVCHRIPSLANHDPAILLRLVTLIRRIEPQLVQTWLPQMDVFGAAAARLTGVPYVLSERSAAGAYPPTWKHRLRAWLGRRARLIIANSSGGSEYWASLGVEPERRVVVHNGIATSDASPDELGAPNGDGTQLILFAGRLSAEKNVEILIEALEGVLPSRPKHAAVLFGDGPLRDRLEARIRQSACAGRIHLMGYTSRLADWMRRASLVVSLSHYEGNPNTILEAMAVGTPVLVSDIPQHREILDERSAVFCKLDSGQDVSRRMLEALDDSSDARGRAAAAQARVADWKIETVAARYEALYRRLCDAQRSPAIMPSR
jgi:glycosyltransferase involved in cell wall biosynthesis